jgi:hypothetical protein
MRPEDEARQRIDDLLVACGWDLQDCSQVSISAARDLFECGARAEPQAPNTQGTWRPVVHA